MAPKRRSRQLPYYLVIGLFILTFVVQDIWSRKNTTTNDAAAPLINSKIALLPRSSTKKTADIDLISPEIAPQPNRHARTARVDHSVATVVKSVETIGPTDPLPQPIKLIKPTLIAPAKSVAARVDSDNAHLSQIEIEKKTSDSKPNQAAKLATIPQRDLRPKLILPNPIPVPMLEDPSLSNPRQDNKKYILPKKNHQAPVLVKSSIWPKLTALEVRIDQLKKECPFAISWADQLNRILQEVRQTKSLASEDLSRLLKELHRTIQQSPAVVGRCKLEEQRILVRRVTHSLERRIELWQLANQIAQARQKQSELAPINKRQISMCIADVRTMTGNSAAALDWQKYLLLDSLRNIRSNSSASDRTLARKALKRLEHAHLVWSKQSPAKADSLAALDKQLRRVANETVDLKQLIHDLETYESSQTATVGMRLARQQKKLKWAVDEPSKTLSTNIESHYRNANLRVAITGELINLLLPQPKPTQSLVNETIANVPVTGRRTTSTTLRIRLLEDKRRIRLGLEASGVVASETSSTSGPAKIQSDGETTFMAKKMVALSHSGLKCWPSVATADSQNEIDKMQTNYDSIPLMNSLIRNMVKRQYDKKRDQAKIDIESKVVQEVKARLDKEGNQRIKQIDQRFTLRWIKPMKTLSLNPTPIELNSTKKRVVARYRLASDQQLGSHTPRPRAPADSLLSMQVHQSVFNNAIQNMQLDGNQYYMDELFTKISKIFGNQKVEVPADLPQDLVIQFAEKDAIQLSMNNGKVEITLRLALIDVGDKQWTDMFVKVVYEPTLDGMQATLQRKQTVSIGGKKLNFRSRLALRGIFTKVFSKEKPLNLIPEQFAKDSRFSKMKISHLKIDDGWLGLAISYDYSKRKSLQTSRSKLR